MSALSKMRRALLGVSHKEATAFCEGESPTWRQLEAAVMAAIQGYHATLDGSAFASLIPRLEAVPLEMRSYAYEGAAMGLTGLDCVLPWKKRLLAYMAGPGEPHIYMVHIGAGEALARLRRRPEPFIARLPDRVICWLVMDGYGFHEGFFAHARCIERQQVPAHLSPYARRIFDQGLGRSIWFRAGAQVERIRVQIERFPPGRQADLWLGIGVACAYVGGLERADIEALAQAAGPARAWMAVGVAFVARGRQRAGNPVPHTRLACQVLWGLSDEQAAQLVSAAFEDLPLDGPEPAFEILQQRLRAQCAARGAAASGA
ncbi:MAG TPA: DUF1702 family protein [Ktedonobacteraceae bacterium]